MNRTFKIRAFAEFSVWFTRLLSGFQVELDDMAVEVRGVDKDGTFQKVTLIASRTLELDSATERAVGEAIRQGGQAEVWASAGFLFPRDMPDAAARVIAESVPMLAVALDRVGGLLRWRYHLPGDHRPPRIRNFVIEFEAGVLDCPMVPSMALGDHDAAVADDADLAIQAMLSDGWVEPIGHELLREARANRLSHPRSALVIGYAAAESGFREFAGILVPDARWLLEKTPTPPLGKMMKDYLPELPVRRRLPTGNVAIPPRVRRVINTAAERRNVVAHTGRDEPEIGEVEAVLSAVSDLLYLLDFYLGHEWALQFVSHSALEEVSHWPL
ncbi:MAG: hypothetical protein E6J14_12740 [Chloroflexi bacterium]|nr:MAG: hypothetical protein E6J14_12740 [Chloroflexota bacterium]